MAPLEPAVDVSDDSAKAESITAAELAAEAEMAMAEQAKAKAAAQALALKAARAKADAERAGREAAEAEEAAMLEAEAAYPTPASAADFLRAEAAANKAREAAALRHASGGEGRFSGVPGGPSILRRSQPQDRRPSDERTSGEHPLLAEGAPGRADEALEWRRRPEPHEERRQPPREFVAAPNPSRAAWTRPVAPPSAAERSWADDDDDDDAGMMPERSWGELRAHAAAAPPPPRAPAWQQQQYEGANGHPPARGGARSFASIQAHEMGQHEMRAKVERLVTMGFGAEAAADMLMQTNGDVRGAALALGRPAAPAWGERRATDAQAWNDLRQREESYHQRRDEVTVKPPAWSPPKSGKVQLMTRSHACASGAAGAAAGSGGATAAAGPAPAADSTKPPMASSERAPQINVAEAPSRAATNGSEATRPPTQGVAPAARVHQPPPCRAAPPQPAASSARQPPPRQPMPSRPHGPGCVQSTGQPPPRQPPRTSAVPNGGGAPAAPGPALSLADKVGLIKAELVLAAGLPMAAAVAAANEQMGLAPEGPLPAQADRLLAIMGLPRATAPKAPPPQPAPADMPQVLAVPQRRGPPQQAQPTADFAPRVLRR